MRKWASSGILIVSLTAVDATEKRLRRKHAMKNKE